MMHNLVVYLVDYWLGIIFPNKHIHHSGFIMLITYMLILSAKRKDRSLKSITSLTEILSRVV
jgi:hypothetical protein